MSVEDLLAGREQQAREHGAWLDTCAELLKRGVDLNDREHDPLACAVRKWGEELHVLRLLKPEHDGKALREARDAYVGQFERGTYPETLPR